MKIKHECWSCKGTGVYSGMGESEEAAIVCHTCKGTGCVETEYTPFSQRKTNPKIKRVYQANPGIKIGSSPGVCELSDFGGMVVGDWYAGKPFPLKSENRKYTCPAWWYQSADSTKKPHCDEMCAGGSFSSCKMFEYKNECWKKWDAQEGDR